MAVEIVERVLQAVGKGAVLTAANAVKAIDTERFGLAGLTVLPIPNIEDIATIYVHAEERRAQLLQGTSTQNTLIYYNATTAHLDALDENYPGRITFFGDEVGLLFFRIRLPIHEIAHLHLFMTVSHLLLQMGLGGQFVATGATTFKGPGTKKKQGDSGIRPDPPRWAGNQFPTVVIEAGNSESLPQLYKDRDMVLLIKVCKRSKRIVIEQWHRFYQSPTAKVEIKPHPQKPFLHDSSCWLVEGAPMVIAFREVFLRPAQGTETDIVLTKDFFAELAMLCWKSNVTV
ncbi:hypothetical protein OQA88_4630 [Cercophora sp. LCS_1]